MKSSFVVKMKERKDTVKDAFGSRCKNASSIIMNTLTGKKSSPYKTGNLENPNQNDDEEDNPKEPGGIKDFIKETNLISNVMAAVVLKDSNFEPLPFTDYSFFEEKYGK